jgi:hypothetical protein
VGRVLGESAAIVAAIAIDWTNGFFPSDLVCQTNLTPMRVYDALVEMYVGGFIVLVGPNLYKLQ